MHNCKVLLIGGHVRSGTTLLWRVCNSHPDIRLTYEFNNFSAIGVNSTEHTRRVFRRMQLKGLFSYNFLDTRKKLNLLNNMKKTINNNIFILKYLYYINRAKKVVRLDDVGLGLRRIFSDKIIVGDKYPHYVFLLDRFIQQENLLILIIYRDCRDVVSSTLKNVRTIWKNQKWIHEYDTAEKISKKWIESVKIMESHKEKIHLVKYENLITDTENEIESIGTYLGLQFPETYKVQIRNDRSGNYMNYLTDDEIKSIMNVAGPDLSRLGYL